MTALTTLQRQLETHIRLKSDVNEEFTEQFHQALLDAINACNLGSVAALENWFNIWRLDSPSIENLSRDETDYYWGVSWVEQQWEAITGMF